MVRVATTTEKERHAEALETSCRLTQGFYARRWPGQVKLTPQEIIPVLNRAGVKFVLMGTHGIEGWMSEPRATEDVDFLIQKRYHRKAIRAIQEAFPQLEIHDQKVVTRFVDPVAKRIVLDLMRPHEPFFQAVFENTVPAGFTHRVPDVEMALVCKFAAMISPNRTGRKKARDVSDFMDVVDRHHEILDLAKLRRLAEMVHRGSGAMILEFVEEAKAGRIPKL
jgi:hypothetical protein